MWVDVNGCWLKSIRNFLLLTLSLSFLLINLFVLATMEKRQIMPARKHKDLLLFDWLSNWSLTASIYTVWRNIDSGSRKCYGTSPRNCVHIFVREKNLLSACNVAEGVWPVYYENFFSLHRIQFFICFFHLSWHYKFSCSISAFFRSFFAMIRWNLIICCSIIPHSIALKGQTAELLRQKCMWNMSIDFPTFILLKCDWWAWLTDIILHESFCLKELLYLTLVKIIDKIPCKDDYACPHIKCIEMNVKYFNCRCHET